MRERPRKLSPSINPRVMTVLINRMAAGDPPALSALYELRADQVYRLVIDAVASNEQAQTVVCDTYASFGRSAPSIKKLNFVGMAWLLDLASQLAFEQTKALRGAVDRPESRARW